MPKNILIISSIDWNENWQMHQQLAKSFSEQKDHVLFIENTGIRTPNILDSKRILIKIQNWLKSTSGFTKISKYLDVYSPIIIPFSFLKIAVSFNSLILSHHLKKYLKYNNIKKYSIITFLPSPLSLKLIKSLNPDQLFYYCANNMSAGSTDAKKIIPIEKKLFKNSDAVFSISRNITLNAKKYNDNVYFFPPGVNFKKFNNAYLNNEFSSELRNFQKPIIGYIGSISKVFDKKLILKISNHFPNCQIIIIGKKYININDLLIKNNISFIDQLKHDDLPRYVKYFKIGLIPYIVNNFTDSVNTCKLNEYLSLAIPVVSTNLFELRQFNMKYNKTVFISENHTEFIKYIELILNNEIEINSNSLIEVAKQNTWEERFSEINKKIEFYKKKQINIDDWQTNFINSSRIFRYYIFKYISIITFLYVVIFYSPIFSIIGNQLIVTDELKKSQAIVVFSGNGEEGYTNIGYQKRAKEAFHIFQQGYSNKIILTSGRMQSISEGKMIESYLFNMGLNKKSLILLDKYPASTYENVKFVKSFLLKNNISNIILLTAPYHSQRSLMTWRKNAPNIEILIANNLETPTNRIRWSIAYKEIKVIIYEILAIIHNKIHNRI